MDEATDRGKIARDANWLADRHDASRGEVSFVHADREAHRAAPFLRDPYLPKSDRAVSIGRAEARAALTDAPAPLHFVFHTAYCCSTLIARAFDAPGAAMGLKEPLILNDLAAWAREGADPVALDAALDDVLALLARPFAPGESVIVKPSNFANTLIDPILRLRPDARAVLMHAPLASYLPSIVNKGMYGRTWVRLLHNNLVAEGRLKLDFTPAQFMELTDLQVAALGWIAQQVQLQGLALRHGRARLATLNSETLLADPAAAMTGLDTLFATGLGPERVAAIVGTVFVRNAKTGDAFDADDRHADRAAVTASRRDEIEPVLDWAMGLIAKFGVPIDLAAPL